MGAAVLEARTAHAGDLEQAAAILAGLGQGAVRLDRDQQRAGVPITGGTKALIAVGNQFEDAGIELDDLGIRRPRSTTSSCPSPATRPPSARWPEES
jgi:ABC-2 type transport system ATP-binding protein